MGLKEVKQEILNEAEKEAEEIKKQAEKKAEEIKKEAREKADSINSEAEKELEEEKSSLKKRAVSGARMEARKKKLKAKEEKINSVFRRFREELEDLDDERKKSFVENAIDRTGFDVGKAFASEGYRELLEDQGLDVETLDDEGFVLQSEDGERQRKFTLERIVESFKESHRGEVAEVLFE